MKTSMLTGWSPSKNIFYISFSFHLILIFNSALLGIFAPMYAADGSILLNQWGEPKFVCPDGAHRCRIQLQKWLENPDEITGPEIVCYGTWKPFLNHTTLQGKKEIHEIGLFVVFIFIIVSLINQCRN
jgi:hypothetical protein